MKHKDVDPSLPDFFHYAFSHAGLLTGPYYTYRTFQDLYSTDNAARADCDGACLRRLSRLPAYIALFLLAGYLFPLKVQRRTPDFPCVFSKIGFNLGAAPVA